MLRVLKAIRRLSRNNWSFSTSYSNCYFKLGRLLDVFYSASEGASLVPQTVNNSPANAEDMGLIPGSGRSPGVGSGYSFQCSCLENSMDRGAWQATVHGATKSQTRLSS